MTHEHITFHPTEYYKNSIQVHLPELPFLPVKLERFFFFLKEEGHYSLRGILAIVCYHCLIFNTCLNQVPFFCGLIIASFILSLLPDLGMQLSMVHLHIFNLRLKHVGRGKPSYAFYFLCLCFLHFFYCV